MPISYCPPLNNFSILICILGLCITLVLYQEQHKLVNTGSAAGVSRLTSSSRTPSLTYIWLQGCLSRYPQYKLWFRTHCNRPQRATSVVRLRVYPFCDPGFLDDICWTPTEGICANNNFCRGRIGLSMLRRLGRTSPSREGFRGDSVASGGSTFSYRFERGLRSRRYGLDGLGICLSCCLLVVRFSESRCGLCLLIMETQCSGTSLP